MERKVNHKKEAVVEMSMVDFSISGNGGRNENPKYYKGDVRITTNKDELQKIEILTMKKDGK